jgi:signal transduction histidine kinase
MTGMVAELYKELNKFTFLNFTPVASYSQEELQNLLESHKCDVLSVYAGVDKHYNTLIPTQPIVKVHFTLLSKPDKSFVSNPVELKDRVLVTNDQAYKEYLLYLYPYLNIEVENDEEKMVEKVLSNKVFGAVVVDPRADYIVNEYGYSKFKINGFLAKSNPIPGVVGVQKDEPILYSIIQKGLANIDPGKIKEIIQSWKITRYQKTVDYRIVWLTITIALLVLGVMAYYQRKLKRFNVELEKLVEEKTKELQAVNDSLEATVQEKVNELLKKDEILTRQSKQAVMGEMISMIAHQWRQPLNTITLQISNLQLKNMVGQDVTKEELLETLENINQTIVYLSNTIDDFKTYFHPDRQAIDIKFTELTQKVMNFISPRLKKNNIILKVLCKEELELNTYLNELIQVLLNIMNNAIDAFESSRDQNVKNIIIRCEVKEDRVHIFLEDNAGGIDKSIIADIFEPYMSTKGKNGTGLGLYMSKMIIEKQFGGDITAKSSNGHTIFTIDIPLDIKK